MPLTLSDIQHLGIVGAGGAGFPTHVKLQARPEMIIMNAAECEPLLHKDKELLLNHADRVLEGFRLAMSFTQASEGVIGVKGRHKALISLLEQKISGRVHIEPLGDFYPAGDEVTLVYLATGRIVQPGALPLQAGCLVLNVETLYNLAASVPVTEKWLTVAGAVARPATLRVPVGTPFRDLLSRFEITASRYIVRSGGLMMGAVENDLDVPVTKTTSGLIVLPDDHPLAVGYLRYSSERSTVRTAKSSCDQCSFCTELCPRYLLGYPVRPETAMRNRMFEGREAAENPGGPGRIEDSVSREAAGGTGGTTSISFGLHPGNAFCCECNLCTLYACPEGLDPKGAALIEKKALRSQNIRWEGLPVRPHPMLPYRKVPMARLKQRLGLSQFRDEAPVSDLEIRPERVRLALRQHLGKPALPAVKKGDRVQKGQIVAAADGNISADVHASIDGLVAEVLEKEIIVARSS
jgi:Na+-translocating ferredoxin:NAD+ oxidoreductase RnfC subunit